MKLCIETTDKTTFIEVEELSIQDDKALEGIMRGLKCIYPWYMTNNRIFHMNGQIESTKLPIFDFYTFIEQFN